MPDKAAQVITAYKERLLAEHVITAPFSVTEIQGGILKKYLIEDDYLAPNRVNYYYKYSFVLWIH